MNLGLSDIIYRNLSSCQYYSSSLAHLTLIIQKSAQHLILIAKAPTLEFRVFSLGGLGLGFRVNAGLD